jgi:hypothetical protein
LASVAGKISGQNIQLGSDGMCMCLGGSWGSVPLGCSAQTGSNAKFVGYGMETWSLT